MYVMLLILILLKCSSFYCNVLFVTDYIVYIYIFLLFHSRPIFSNRVYMCDALVIVYIYFVLCLWTKTPPKVPISLLSKCNTHIYIKCGNNMLTKTYYKERNAWIEICYEVNTKWDTRRYKSNISVFLAKI